ncbi:hypothetical protein VPHD51_0210 [Vibrio phage D51]
MIIKAAIVTEPPKYNSPAKWRSVKLESDEHLPHTCPQCESLDPRWQCDSCEGCEDCTEQCSLCENNTCLGCCEGHEEGEQ